MPRIRKATKIKMEFIAANIDAANLIELICQEYDCTKRHARALVKKYKDSSCSEGLLLPVVIECECEHENTKTYDVGPVEKLPSTEEELKQYRYKNVLSPEARAMRIDALIQATHQESGIAKMKALEMLDEMMKEYNDTTNEPEPVFFTVHSTKNTPGPKD